jgi:glycine/D-amino acid oxidase-like deaminating enzyme
MIYDAVVIGGGFYGASIAAYLLTERKKVNVVVIEQYDGLLTRASLKNQARVHCGYHYPRSFTTAFRSRVNLSKFTEEFNQAIDKDFLKVYAIAKHNSKVTANQFVKFCNQIGAAVSLAPKDVKSLFNKNTIEDVFIVNEYAFDAKVLATLMQSQMNAFGVELKLLTEVEQIDSEDDLFTLSLRNGANVSKIESRLIFNCTYSGINQIKGNIPKTYNRLKHEITEMLLVQPPEVLNNKGFTLMDGPFFSMMPYPSRNLHTLSHVRYTPHTEILDAENPYVELENYAKESRMSRMIRDSARYIPEINRASYVESIFEVKTVLLKNEVDDGRPILFEKNCKGYYSVLGSKIDNIYDILERLDLENI